jgi:hypothetical protein
MTEPNYRAFARDLMKLCKKHGVKLSAYNEGMVFLGPAKAKIAKKFPYSSFSASPTEVDIGDDYEDHSIRMKAGEDAK